MLSPIREDTLEFHHRQLRFMRYPIAFFLVANISCVLHALTRQAAPEVASVTPAADTSVIDAPRTTIDVIAAPVADPPISSTNDASMVNDASVADAENGASQSSSTGGRNADQIRQQWLSSLRKRQVDWKSSRAKTESKKTIVDESTVLNEDGADSSPVEVVAAKDEVEAGLASGETKVDTQEPAVELETADKKPVATETDIIVLNPAGNSGSISFLLKDELTTLRPGEHRILKEAENVTARFHRGGEYGNASVELKPGEYSFIIGATGWQLVRD